jgi:hypothetical protein
VSVVRIAVTAFAMACGVGEFALRLMPAPLYATRFPISALSSVVPAVMIGVPLERSYWTPPKPPFVM